MCTPLGGETIEIDCFIAKKASLILCQKRLATSNINLPGGGFIKESENSSL